MLPRTRKTLPALVKRVKPAVVAIATYDANGEAVDDRQRLLPAARTGGDESSRRCVAQFKREIKTLDGKGKVFPVNGTLAVDEEGDLALLSVDMPLRALAQKH